MSDDTFTLSYDGTALANGLMDVRELAPALLATGELIQNTNRLINGDATQISLQVKSDFRKGSFNIDLLLNQNLIDQAKQFLHGHPGITDAKNLLDILFFYGGLPVSVGTSVFAFIKWLKGRSIADGKMTIINNGTIINFQLGEDSIQVSDVVVKLVQSESIRKSAEGIVRPLKREGITELRLEGGENRFQKLSKEDADYFSSGFNDGEVLHESEFEGVFEIVRLSFDPRHKWGLSNGATRIRVLIEDPLFWSEVKYGKRFAKGDHIKARIWVRTFRDESGELKSEYAVREVLRHMPRQPIAQIKM